MRVLLINPNTSVPITERMAASARTALQPDDHLSAVTASSGPRVVRDAEQLRLAEATALALADAHAAAHDALVLAISLDGMAATLRERHPDRIVVGMTEAALLTGCLRVQRLGLLTVGTAMLPLYRDRVAAIGLGSRVVAFEAPEIPQAFAADETGANGAVLAALADAARRLQLAGAQAVVLAGAVLCGHAALLEARLAMPVLDGVVCAIHQCRALLAAARGESMR